MSSLGLGEMFEGDSADRCAGKFPLVSMGVRAECPTCADTVLVGPSGAMQTVSDSRRPLFLVINLLLVVVVGGDIAQTL